jgi:hypothetical protein
MALDRPERRVVRRVALTGGLIGLMFVAANVAGTTVPPPGSVSSEVPYVRLYDTPHDRLEVLIDQGDGQAFAALAQDPTLSRPDVFRGGSPEAAYRAQRPLLGWLAWVTSLGHAGAVPGALFVWAVVGFALLGAAAATFVASTGREPRFAVIVLALPGALITLDWTGPEALGVALALAGLVLWRRARPPLAATAVLFAIAGLCRETLLLVPLALGAGELLWGSRSLKRLAALIVGPAAYGLWVVVVHARLQAWPTDARQGRLSWPFVGVGDAIGGWSAVDGAFALLAVALAVAAIRRRPRSDEALIVLVHVAFAVCLGGAVWARLEDFGRVLLPLYVVGVLALLPDRPDSALDANISS